MAKGQDKPPKDSDAPEMSAKALEIQKQIRAGTYRVDVEALADRLIDSGDLDDVVEEQEQRLPVGEPQNDQKPRGK